MSTMTPWFIANEYRPVAAGPYECKMSGADEEAPTHMRWFDGESWSLPLQEEHESLDGEFIQPARGYFYYDDSIPANEQYEFVWRGFNEDQEPL